LIFLLFLFNNMSYMVTYIARHNFIAFTIYISPLVCNLLLLAWPSQLKGSNTNAVKAIHVREARVLYLADVAYWHAVYSLAPTILSCSP
jgi:hypothetical protein